MVPHGRERFSGEFSRCSRLTSSEKRGDTSLEGIEFPILPDWQLPTVTLWSVTPGRRLLPARTRVFVDMLKEALAEG